jgi:hypothetical protein
LIIGMTDPFSKKDRAAQEGPSMVATIQLSPYIYVQGIIARTLPNGQIAILDGDREYVGRPLQGARRVAQPLAAVEQAARG